MSLLPCPSCSRHVRRTETACPFCHGVLALDPEAATRSTMPRLGRAALFTFGAAIATTSGCGVVGGPVALYGGPAYDSGPPIDAALARDASSDAGQPMTLYGGPVLHDAGELHPDTGGSSADYGAPPAP